MQKKTCIIVPCFNELERLETREFINFCTEHGNIDFCFVNDGSTDNTKSMLDEMVAQCGQKAFVVDVKLNMGKAEAVRLGIVEALTHAKYDFIGFTDADLSVPLSEIESLVTAVETTDMYKMIIGSRIKRLGANIIRNEFRHYVGRVMSTIASLILRLPVYDTQCGFKIFNVEYAEVISSNRFITTWLFDVEIFAKLINTYGLEIVKRSTLEVPLSIWIEKGNSKVKFNYVYKLPFEFYKLYKLIR
jgi:glycosyltransferase involved in cell wall biosynthesis